MTDINECNGLNDCDNGTSFCSNEAGSYSCTCLNGYTGNGTVCIETNYCHNKPCGSHGNCNSLLGGYSCDCANGFSGKNCETASEGNSTGASNLPHTFPSILPSPSYQLSFKGPHVPDWIPFIVYGVFGVVVVILFGISRFKAPKAKNSLILFAGLSLIECGTDCVFLLTTYRLPDP